MSRLFEVSEAFMSWQGEGIRIGRSTFFLRMARCNLDCFFCDTMPDPVVPATLHEVNGATAFSPPDRFVLPVHYVGDLDGLAVYMKAHGLPEPGNWYDICITGGEPTLYDLRSLSQYLREHKYGRYVTVESNGLSAVRWADCDLWWTISPKLQIPAGARKHSEIFVEFYKAVVDARGGFLGQLKLVLWLPGEGEEYNSFIASGQFLSEVMEEIGPEWVRTHLILQPLFEQSKPILGTPEELEAIFQARGAIKTRGERPEFLMPPLLQYIQDHWDFRKFGGRIICQTHKVLGVR